MDGTGERVGEDQVVVILFFASDQLLSLLACVMDAHHIDRFPAQGDRSFAVSGLRGGKLDPISVGSEQLTLDLERLPDPNQVSPLQAKQLHLSHSCHDRQVIESLPAVPVCSHQELANLALVEYSLSIAGSLGGCV
jgi:hypothetical protein